MSNLGFEAEGLDLDQVELWRKLRPKPPRVPGGLLAAGVLIVAVLYTTNHPGEIRIEVAAVVDESVTERSVLVTGTVSNPSVQTVTVSVNRDPRTINVVDGGFSTRVPLTPGSNTIVATAANGVSSLLVPDSNVIALEADIPVSDIWAELTWEGAGDIDLHLTLPDGEVVFFENPASGGAFLDFDNTERDGPEHIFMDEAIPGTYRMKVVYFAEAGAPRPVPWYVRLQLRGTTTLEFSGILAQAKDETEFWTTVWDAE